MNLYETWKSGESELKILDLYIENLQNSIKGWEYLIKHEVKENNKKHLKRELKIMRCNLTKAVNSRNNLMVIVV